MNEKKRSLLQNKGVQSLLASLLCILAGLLIGYLVLLIINPAGAWEAIVTIVENFLYYPSPQAQIRYFGNTLVKTAPLLMCSLSVLFAYKVGLFNIGAAGQYVIGAGACLYCALAWQMPWFVCMLAAVAAGALPCLTGTPGRFGRPRRGSAAGGRSAGDSRCPPPAAAISE